MKGERDHPVSSFILPPSSFDFMSATAVILAAGKSTRLKSKRPKPLHEVCGKPMLRYILDACFESGVQHVILVVGHGKDEVMAMFGEDKRITFVEQTEQLGTGHAVRVCEAQIRKHPGDVFILAGDGPLIRAEVLRTLLQAHREEKAAASMATAMVDDPTGYGRIVRDGNGEFVEIVEHSDASAEQREIREVFPSYYCLRSEDLLNALSKIQNNNRKSEYYLTDAYAILRKSGRKVIAVQAVTQDDVLSVNTRAQLAQVDEIMQCRIHQQMRESGVTIVSSESTYIESGATIGSDTTIYPFTFIGRDSSIGADCVIGPFAMIPRESIVPGETVVEANATTPGVTLGGRI
jgi:bifunctional UDP-N-acetylglucosamine pyrophosphorylase / glucosamine-1-phosphate N-acetyltransferase